MRLQNLQAEVLWISWAACWRSVVSGNGCALAAATCSCTSSGDGLGVDQQGFMCIFFLFWGSVCKIVRFPLYIKVQLCFLKKKKKRRVALAFSSSVRCSFTTPPPPPSPTRPFPPRRRFGPLDFPAAPRSILPSELLPPQTASSSTSSTPPSVCSSSTSPTPPSVCSSSPPSVLHGAPPQRIQLPSSTLARCLPQLAEISRSKCSCSPDYKGYSSVSPLLVTGTDKSTSNLHRRVATLLLHDLHYRFRCVCTTSSTECLTQVGSRKHQSLARRTGSAPCRTTLQYVLGFLRANETVHTSLLTRRWRYLWKSVRRLRINFVGSSEESDEVFLNRFVNCLLLLRDPSSTLDEVEFDYGELDGDSQYIGTWIRHALSNQAQVISARFPCERLDGPRLVSEYLRRLEISEVELRTNFLDFSCCSVLESLKIEDCILDTHTIVSQSLKHLSIKRWRHSRDNFWFHISVPNLVSLQLVSYGGRMPLLESMLSLETAILKLYRVLKDFCGEGYAGQCCGICADCCGTDAHEGSCVLLGGLSHAKKLELIAYPGMLIFRRDLRWCPAFSKLKTLLLNEWCVQPDLSALVCILEHSPVLEHLTLQLCKQKENEKLAPALDVEENHSLMEKPAAISGCPKTIKVKFEEMDGRVCKVLKFLSTFDMEIIMERKPEYIDGLVLFYS